MKKKILIPVISAAFVIPLAFSCNKGDNTCNVIKSHYRDYIYNTTNIDDYVSKPTNKILEELTPIKVNGVDTYKFNNINYDIDYSRSSWPAAGHLSRTLKIAIVAESRNSNELREIAKKLTYHWVFSNYHNINWWQNELGANNTLASLGLFTFDYLGKKGQDAFNGKVRESSLKWRPSVSTHTGANVFDYIDITCRDAAINNDKEEMTIAFNRLADEITNTGIEGFQKDGSFFQHGRQVQNVSYGKSIIRVARTLYQFRDTNYHMPDSKMQILSDYVSRGIGQSTFKGYTNYTTVSREFSRFNNLDTQANGFNDLAYFMGVTNYPNKETTYNIVDSLRNRTNSVKTPTVTYFPVAKMIVANIGQDPANNKDGIYISYKGTEPNLCNTECVNGENQLGLNLSYGTNTCVMDKGTEYFNIAPAMDYNFMPGTTSPMYGGDAPTQEQADAAIKEYANLYGDQLYGRQVPKATKENGYIYNDGQKDGVTYIMTKTQHHDAADYTVTCFTTNDGMVLVGSNLNYDSSIHSGSALGSKHTTVDQYITSDAEGTETPTDKFLNHSDGNVEYRSLDGKNLNKEIKTVSYEDKAWTRNNRDYKYDETKPSVSKNVAKITIDTSDTNASYAYSIEPKHDGESKFTLMANTDGVHAIKLSDGKIYAAFYKKDAKFGPSEEYYLSDAEQSQFDNNVGKGIFKTF